MTSQLHEFLKRKEQQKRISEQWETMNLEGYRLWWVQFYKHLESMGKDGD